MRTYLTSSRRPRGLTLLEVSIAVGVLATAIMGIFSLFVTSERMKILAREESIAMYAAEEKINEIRSRPFSTTYLYDTGMLVSGYHNTTYPINLDGPKAVQQRLSMGPVSAVRKTGNSTADELKVTDELGIFIINAESPVEENFGDPDGDGDLDFPIDLNQNGSFTDTLNTAGTGLTFPMDLGGDTALVNETIAVTQLKLAPIAVVVRWMSLAGLERRIQILTFITDRSGRY